MYKNILFPTDLGTNSRAVLNKAISLAKANEATLILGHVQSILIPTVATEAATIPTTVVSLSDDEEGLLKHYRDIAKEQGVKDVRIIVEDSVNVVGTIVDVLAKENDVDLIITGSSNTHGLTGFLLGSTSSGIAKHAKCDVFIVKDKIKKDNE